MPIFVGGFPITIVQCNIKAKFSQPSQNIVSKPELKGKSYKFATDPSHNNWTSLSCFTAIWHSSSTLISVLPFVYCYWVTKQCQRTQATGTTPTEHTVDRKHKHAALLEARHILSQTYISFHSSITVKLLEQRSNTFFLVHMQFLLHPNE